MLGILQFYWSIEHQKFEKKVAAIDRAAATPVSLTPFCKAEVTALMHWFLLVVASSMTTEEIYPRADLPPCDVFLAPSTIPKSACIGA